MIDSSDWRPAPGSRRRRLSLARRTSSTGRFQVPTSAIRAGFHVMMVMVGLVAAVTVWNGASDRLELRQAGSQAADASAASGDVTDEGAVDGMALTDSGGGVATATGEPMRPLVRRVIEGDT